MVGCGGEDFLSGFCGGNWSKMMGGWGFDDGNRGFLLQWVGEGVFCNGATWGGFFATVPRGFFASVPRRFFASVFTSRQGNFKTTKITAGKLRFFGISSYS